MVKQIISKAVGIDLGTTNSAVAVMNPTDTDIIIHRHRTGSQTTPSCVWKDPKKGEIVVGMKAFQRIGSIPAPVRSIKRSMGQQIKVPLADKVFTPEEISGFILNEEKKQIEEDLAALSNDSAAWIADRAIITVPAYFDQPQIEATRKAGELVGFEVIDLLHEPTAAACYYCWLHDKQQGTFLVYDYGGGTFDVAIIRSTEGVFEVLGIAGNNRLGGDDLDHVIAEDLRERLIAEGYALDLDLANSAEDQLRFTQLKFLAEGLKKTLSNSLETILRDQTMRDMENNSMIIEIPFERKDIEKLMLPLINRTIPYCFDALEIAEKKAGIWLADIDAIILAGGSTHIPLVREVVRQNLCSVPDDQVRKELIADARAEQPRAQCPEPVYEKVDTLVALGAAIRASAVGGLVVYNPERTLMVTFRGVGLSGREKTHIGGKVKALDPGIDLTGASIHLSITGTAFEDETILTNKDESLQMTEGTFAFKQIPLQAASTNLLSFEIHDRNGVILMGAERQVAQDTQSADKPTGGPSQSATLSKPIILEVNREGRPYLKEIFAALDSIPQQKKLTFYHPGDTERIRIPLYQKKRKIQEIIVNVSPSLTKGTPIDLDIAIDALYLITVKGSIGDQTFDAVITPPPERDMPTEEELKSLEKSFAEAKVFLPTGKRAVLEARFNMTWESLKNARTRGDKDQTIHDLEEIEGIIAEASQVKSTIEPPLATFMDFVQENYKLNMQVASLAANHGQPHDHREMAKAIDAQREYGEKAFQEGDQTRYSDAIRMLEGIKNHLIGLGSALIKEPVDDSTPQEKAQQAVARSQSLWEKVEKLVQGDDPKKKRYKAEVTTLQSELKNLAKEAQKDPTTVRERAAQIGDKLKRIYDVMMGISSDDNKDGLIEDHDTEVK